MTALPPDASDEAILAFVDSWVDDLARGDFSTAFNKTKHDPYYAWTPELIQHVVAGYGLPEPAGAHRVTERASARGSQHHRLLDRGAVPPGALAVIRYDLPLDGEWSDLTVTFRVEHDDAGIFLTLEEIHVF